LKVYPLPDFSMTLKIVFVLARSDEIGGAHIHVRDMASYVNKMGGEAIIVAGGDGVFANLIRDSNIQYISILSLGRGISLVNDFIAFLRLNALLRGLKCDLISLHSAKAGVLGRLLGLLPGIPPILFTAHGWSFALGVPAMQRFIYIKIESLLGVFSKKIITVCNADKLLALSLGVAPESKISVIHNGMPYLPIRLKCEKSSSDSSRVNIISVARFEKQKDHETLLRALAMIPARNWHLTLVGGGPGVKSVMNLALDLQIMHNLTFAGRCYDVVPFLDNSDIFVLSSLWEGFPRSILEALRASLPVVASDVGGVSESVINNYNGYCVPSSDADSLAIALLKLIQDPVIRRKMGERGRSLYEAKFTFSHMAEATYELYRSIVLH